MEKDFVRRQEMRIINRIKKYENSERIKTELKNGGLSPYTIYKQEAIVPILKKALEKINRGDYGLCEKCGKKIERERLELIPAAEKCIKCKE